MSNRPPLDDEEHAGAGLRELHGRFNTAKTRHEYLDIAAEAERRAIQPGLESSLETAYGVLASLARKRAASFAAGEADEATGIP
jgi:hypothetical protein